MSMPAHSLHQLSQRYASGELSRSEYLHQREMMLDRLQANADAPPTPGQAISVAPVAKTESSDCNNSGYQSAQEKVTRSRNWLQHRSGPVSMRHYVIPAVAFTLVVLLSLFLLSLLW